MKPISVLAGPPSSRLNVFGRAWNARWANESPSTASSGFIAAISSSSVIFALSRSVAACAASSSGHLREVVERDRVAEDDLQLGAGG